MHFALGRKMLKPPIARLPAIQMDFINRPSGETDCSYENKGQVNFDTALTDFIYRQFKTGMKKIAAQVNFFCFLMFFSVWLAIWCLKIGTFVLIKVLLTYLL